MNLANNQNDTRQDSRQRHSEYGLFQEKTDYGNVTRSGRGKSLDPRVKIIRRKNPNPHSSNYLNKRTRPNSLSRNRSARPDSELRAIFDSINQQSQRPLPYTILDQVKTVTQRHPRIQSLNDFHSQFTQIRHSRTTTSADSLRKLELIYGFVLLKKKFRLRPVQVFAVAISVHSESSRSAAKKLLQVNTGEGKTLVSQCVALFQVLSGRRVDIVTSTELLAKDNFEEASDFFEGSGVSVARIDSDLQTRGSLAQKRKCYSADIVYGTCHQFCVDILAEHSDLERVRVDADGRPRAEDVVIVDEVDNMLIDNFSNMTIISDSIGNFLEVERAKETVWKQTLAWLREQNRVNYDDKYKNLRRSDVVSGITKRVEHKLKTQLKINTKNGTQPDYPRTVVKELYSTWVESALQAVLDYARDQQYIVTRDEQGKRIVQLVNVDTGMNQKGMRLQDGVHEFLERKEGLRMDGESSACFFKSCVSFFCSYTSIIGLTGTLGSENFRDFFKQVYGTDSYVVPPFVPSRLQKDSSHYALYGLSEQSWLNEIYNVMTQKQNEGRAVLLIFRTIRQLKLFRKILESKGISYLEYFNSDDSDNSARTKNIGQGTVILATNLGGRGTDFQLDERVVRNGGLHVVLTFFTENSRVEAQAFGRAARKGEPGTAQLIVNLENHPQLMDTSQRNAVTDRGRIVPTSRVKNKDQIRQIKLEMEQHLLERIKIDIEFHYKMVEDFLGRLTGWIDKNRTDIQSNGAMEIIKMLFVVRLKNLRLCIRDQMGYYRQNGQTKNVYLRVIREKAQNQFKHFEADYDRIVRDLTVVENPSVLINYLVTQNVFADREASATDMQAIDKVVKQYPHNIEAKIIKFHLSKPTRSKNFLNKILEAIQVKVESLERYFNESLDHRRLYNELYQEWGFARPKSESKQTKDNNCFQSSLRSRYIYAVATGRRKSKPFEISWTAGDHLFEIYDEWARLILIWRMLEHFRDRPLKLSVNPLTKLRDCESILGLCLVPLLEDEHCIKDFERLWQTLQAKQCCFQENPRLDSRAFIREFDRSKHNFVEETKKIKKRMALVNQAIGRFWEENSGLFKDIVNKLRLGMLFGFYVGAKQIKDSNYNNHQIRSALDEFEDHFRRFVLEKSFQLRNHFAEEFLKRFVSTKTILDDDFAKCSKRVMTSLRCSQILGEVAQPGDFCQLLRFLSRDYLHGRHSAAGPLGMGDFHLLFVQFKRELSRSMRIFTPKDLTSLNKSLKKATFACYCVNYANTFRIGLNENGILTNVHNQIVNFLNLYQLSKREFIDLLKTAKRVFKNFVIEKLKKIVAKINRVSDFIKEHEERINLNNIFRNEMLYELADM